ncbi:hypothetical protein HDU99_002050 [Rhizoclosmatium hyalinum]|nr:hypothetical protein HDU99_002050 [Rhizoclosmatium hyalinum]
MAFTPVDPNTITDIVVLGDSLSDNGNLLQHLVVYPPPPYWKGRFCNGPIWVEYLAEYLNNAKLHDYAYGGSHVNGKDALRDFISRTVTEFVLPLLEDQVKTFKEYNHTLKVNFETTLFIVWDGANDLDDTYFSGQEIDGGPVARMAVDSIKELVDYGAKHILVGKMAPLDLIPTFNKKTELLPKLRVAMNQFNDALDAGIAKIKAHSSANIVTFDPRDVLEFATSPEGQAKFGFKNVTDPCFVMGRLHLPEAPEEHLFWDFVHPTTKAQKHLAEHAYNVFFYNTSDLGREN